MAGIVGKKLGMTQLFSEEGDVISVTAVEAGPCTVTAVRTLDKDGYDAVQLAFGKIKTSRLSKGELGHLKKAGADPSRTLIEFRGQQELKIGDQVTVESFEKGQRIRVTARSKGKGFQGNIKRHGAHRGPVSHGSRHGRAPGSIGASATPSKVIKGMKMPGQMGNRRVTQAGLELTDVDIKRNLLLIKGSVPGPVGGFVEVRSG